MTDFSSIPVRINGTRIDASWWNSIRDKLIESTDDDTAQTFTNKIIDGSLNTISNLTHGDQVDNPTSGVHGVVGDIVGTSDTQDVSNKAIIDPSRLDVKKDTEANLTTYAISANDGQLCFSTDTLKTFVVHTGVLNDVGGGGGQGGINYIENYNAEDGLDGWTVTGTIPLSLETVDPLFDTQSFKIASAGGTDYSGNYVKTTTKTMDNAIKYNILSGELWCRNEDLDTGDLKIRVYDIDNAEYVTILNGEDIGASLAGSFTHKFEFQAKDGVNYIVEAYVVTTTTNAFEFVWDNIILGPQKPAVIGAAITNWKAYTPSFNGLGTVTAIDMEWRQVVENLEIRGRFTIGTAAAVNAYFSLPPGLTARAVSDVIVGQGGRAAAAVGNDLSFIVDSTDLTNVGISIYEYRNPLLIAFGTSLFAPGETVAINQISIPIQGWGSQVQMTETTMNTNISANLYRASNQVVSGITTDVKVELDTILGDTVGASDIGNNEYIIPETGWYTVGSSVEFASANVSTYRLETIITVDGTEIDHVYSPSDTAGNGTTLKSSILVPLNKNDIVRLFARSINDGNYSIIGGQKSTWLSVQKTNTGTQTIGISRKVYVKAEGNAGEIGVTIMPYITVTDSHKAWSGTVFTSPKAANYLVAGAILAAFTGEIHLIKNGAAIEFLGNGTPTDRPAFSTIVHLDEGETMSIGTSVSTTVSDVAFYHHIDIHSL